MADQEWLARLAEARFQGGAWVHADPNSVQRLAEERGPIRGTWWQKPGR